MARPLLHRLEVIRQSFRLPPPTFDLKVSATEKAAERLTNESIEPWSVFWKRVGNLETRLLRWGDQSRLIRESWSHAEAQGRLSEVLAFCSETRKKAPRNLLLKTYLMEFPQDHPSFASLASTCADIASHPDTDWHSPGAKFALWNPAEGTKRLGKSIAENRDYKDALNEAGLSGELHRSGFAKAAVVSLCKRYSTAPGSTPENVGLAIKTVLTSDRFPELRGLLAVSLLAPWLNRAPSRNYRNDLARALTKFGDPREKGPEWNAIAKGAQRHLEPEIVEDAIALLSRWLGEESVREFFRIIARSTGNSQHWASRERFWSSYLDAGLIDEAWFALGPVAQGLVASNPSLRGGKFAKLGKASASDEQSTLIMKIANTVIAEWSDNGACRFWLDTDASAPILYKSRYDSKKLRTTNGGEGFTYLAHRGGWQRAFAQQIRRMTGIAPPR